LRASHTVGSALAPNDSSAIDDRPRGRHCAVVTRTPPQKAVPNILVADDNPVTLRFFAEAMAQLGFACELAANGAEAVAHARRAQFDLLLFDARMPLLDGTQALANIRAESGPSRRAPAVATTADTDESGRRTLIAAGFADVIIKPVTIGALRVALARHLSPSNEAEPTGSAQVDEPCLDDAGALAAVGGDRSILAALRGLLVAELDALPTELSGISARGDIVALRDRLHRLDASAGFCGVPALARAGAKLRSALDAGDSWPDNAAGEFLAACADVRARLLAPDPPAV
jgi:CheY-like chemotaxis protein/HPt (histidine-containing phosphotransfer) domain-containing protein